MEVDGKGSPWRHCRLVTSRHATWSCLLSVGNALSTANLFFSLIGLVMCYISQYALFLRSSIEFDDIGNVVCHFAE